ncbi:DUF4130 domain-containing protein [archaeon]|nr:DUF4130 domain-containing protein [archaeon]
MQVVYDEGFNNLVKACILSEVKGYNPVKEPNLNSKEFVSVKDYTMNQLFIEWDWVNGTPHDVSALENAITLALRHRCISQELVFNVISQALKWGVDYVLTRQSLEAKRFCNKVFSVREELRDAKLNMKFMQNGDTLFGRYFFSHNISDLLLQFYQKRFPDKRVVIVNHADSYSVVHANPCPVLTPSQGDLHPAGISASAVTLNSFF